MLERMDAFFEARLEGYDEHMLNEIEGAKSFYPFTAAQLPAFPGASVLDLGCGTGLELEWYFAANPQASVIGVDLSQGMLERLRSKFEDRELSLICGSYFDVPFGDSKYDAAVSVESLHHFTKEQKTPLYAKLHAALKDGAFFILTDYFAPSDTEETLYRNELVRLKKENGIADDAFYHYDTPLTVAHETQALMDAGFAQVEVLDRWGNTHTLKAMK